MNNITIARNLAGLTRPQLAEALGVSKSQIDNWSSGLRNPGKENAAAISAVLGVDVAWIMGCPQTMAVQEPFARYPIECKIVRSEAIEGYGTLHHLYNPETGDVFAAILADGVQITTTDWQSIDAQPRSAEEIGDCRWMDVQGRDCIMLDGLPRVFM